MSGNLVLGTVTISGGVASLTVSNLNVGTDDIAAMYSGDANDMSSKSPTIAITVLQAPTITTVSSSQSPIQTLTPVTISAMVSNGGSQNPTGLVTFSEDGVSIGVGSLNPSGVATISLPSLTAGNHTFAAAYAGDALDIPSVSAPFSQTVQQRPTTDVLTTSLGCLGLPQGATCTFSQDKPALAAGGSQTVNVTVDTGSPLLSGSQARNESEPRTGGILTCILPGCFALGFIFLRVRRLQLFGSLLLVIMLLGVSTGLSGCGSIQNNGTPPGTYHFLITATTSTGVSQSVNMTLTITE